MLSHIQQLTPDLSRAEQRVARWVMQHPKQASRATLAEVARECGTSEPTVIRFCRSVGLGGFRDFTRELTAALSRPASYVHRDVSADDDLPDAVAKVLEASIQSLADVRSRLSAMPIAAAVQAMSTARQLAFVGLGASGHVALDACQKFFRLGIPCTTLTDTPTILQYAAIADSATVMIITSQTGRWPELTRAAELAQNGGAKVVALTDPDTDLGKVADVLFSYHALEDTSVYTPMSSRLAQLALLDALQVALALEIGDPAIDKLRRSKDVLHRKELR